MDETSVLVIQKVSQALRCLETLSHIQAAKTESEAKALSNHIVENAIWKSQIEGRNRDIIRALATLSERLDRVEERLYYRYTYHNESVKPKVEESENAPPRHCNSPGCPYGAAHGEETCYRHTREKRACPVCSEGTCKEHARVTQPGGGNV